MQNAEQQIGQLDLSTKKRICLYLFQEGIGYKRTAKILGLNLSVAVERPQSQLRPLFSRG